MAVSGSTATTMACVPFAVVPYGGPKYEVASRPGSIPGATAPRRGLAARARAPSSTETSGAPFTRATPSASSRSSGSTSSASPAWRRIFSRTDWAAAWIAFPATTAPRLAKVPVPQWNSLVSPVTTRTSDGATPTASATICAKEVKCPWPCVPTPVARRTVPLGSTVTRAPS